MAPDSSSTRNLWEQVETRVGGPVRARLLFFAVYLVLLWLEYAFKESAGVPTLLRPSAGLLFVALWFSGTRAWPFYLAVHVLCALALGAAIQHPFPLQQIASAALAAPLAAVSGALACRWLNPGPLTIHARLVPGFIWSAVLGSLAGTSLAAVVTAWHQPAQHDFWLSVLAWGVGHLLGTLTIAPVLLAWMALLRNQNARLALRSRGELAGIAFCLVASICVLFPLANARHGSVLALPLLVGPVLVYACFRLPPRWAMSMSALAILLMAAFAAQRTPPFAVPDPIIRVGTLQMLFGIFAVMVFILSIVVSQVRITLARLAESDQRYRNFVQLSHEAMWRVEVDPPMPVELAPDAQLQWLRTHARIAESSLSYARMDSGATAKADALWSSMPWVEQFEQRLPAAVQRGLDMHDVNFSVPHQGRKRDYLASFSAEVEAGKLLRFWGVARDVTELTDLNTRLLREKDRLKSYARQIIGAEEKARRSTAVDLHDGIGQTLVGLAMMVEAAHSDPPADVRALLAVIGDRLRDVQEHTRRMISDLSPPGLYDLGLGGALQWLSVYLRSHDGLRVELECRLQEAAIRLEMRVLVFKLVRELLRNVIKHAGVQSARVLVEGDAEQLRVVVSDQGCGFESQIDMFGARSGYGLWSIADRVQEVGGQFEVDAGVGRGARFEICLPLRTESVTARNA
ncbi:MAG: MASE1 domain-containing protein [Pseudomonadota bacterium]